MRHLIINADGYAFTEGISRAIEECVAFGTVRSLSANVNFARADGLRGLVQRFPYLSVGCHLNPIVGRPLSPTGNVRTLLDGEGNFHYRNFARKFRRGEIDRSELRTELMAQVERTRELAGDCFSHVDFHMGLHRLPGLYPIFLDVAAASGTGRIRTHRYLAGMESRHPRVRHVLHLLGSVDRIPKYGWNLLLRAWARRRGFAMPDYWLSITQMGRRADAISVGNYERMLQNLPRGFSEFVAHPAYLDDELSRWSTYLEDRVREREVLLDTHFRDALRRGPVKLAGYRDIPLRRRPPLHAPGKSRDPHSAVPDAENGCGTRPESGDSSSIAESNVARV